VSQRRRRARRSALLGVVLAAGVLAALPAGAGPRHAATEASAGPPHAATEASAGPRHAAADASAGARPPRPDVSARMPQPGLAGDAVGSLPRPHVLAAALRAYGCALAREELARPVLAVIDYSLPSTERRLWVIDLDAGRATRHELVAHGRGSGELMAEQFSNLEGSHQSSLGLFVTRATYRGRHGLSLRLAGLEPGVNDRAESRAIVMHGARYVSEAHAERWGRLGRSLGCPALDRDVAAEVIAELRGGAALFAYAEDPEWLAASPYQRCAPREASARVDTASR